MIEMNLEEEIILMASKEMRRQELQGRLHFLLREAQIGISYDLDLTKAEQIKYASIGIFYYGLDLNGKSKAYKSTPTESGYEC